MDITSLQDLIAKFNGNFNLQPKKDPAASAPTAPAAPALPATDGSTKELSDKDKLTLSAEAQAYMKAHTLASGKFMAPNVFGDFMSALDGSDSEGESANDGLNSLLDTLNGKSDSGSPTDAITSGDLPKLLDKLKDFLG